MQKNSNFDKYFKKIFQICVSSFSNMKNALKNAVSLKRYNSETMPLRQVVPEQKLESETVATTHLDMAESFWDTLYMISAHC